MRHDDAVTITAGQHVRLELTKWGDLPHWEFDATFLGSDEHGDWIGIPAGTFMARPGATFTSVTDQVGLVPGEPWLATFHAPGYEVATYVDMTTVPWWDLEGAVPVCRAVDLDLDVIRGADGSVVVDDVDEFAEHQVELGYPPDVVALAQASCAWVHDAVLHERNPFDGVHLPWLERLGSALSQDAAGPAAPHGVPAPGPARPGAGLLDGPPPGAGNRAGEHEI